MRPASEPIATKNASDRVPRPHGSGVVFVTGAAGFVGQHVAASFLEAGWSVVGLGYMDAETDGLQLPAPRHWFPGPIAEGSLRKAAGAVGPPEAIIHAAGGSSVGASVSDPAMDFERTVGSVREVLEFMRSDSPATRLILLSSAAVYGRAAEESISELAPPNPISPYGLHKKLAEDLIRGWADMFGLDASIVRFFSLYGPGNRKQLLWDVANRLCKRPRTLELAGNGQEARDFLHIDDAVRLIGLIAGLERSAVPAVVNGGSGEATTVREVAEALCRALAPQTKIAFSGAVRAGDPQSLVSNTALARDLGFSPHVPFATGLDRFAAWVESTVAGVRV